MMHSNSKEPIKLAAGRTYRAKKPRNAGWLVNDRTVIYIGSDSLQYDGPSVKAGSKYPSVSKVKFIEWADRDVTDELPAGEYAEWPIKEKSND
uniref:hypothetical protein n=1 Tax=Hafnia alvei TaxID=569 RepID=UPI00242E81B6|nr:hypothetical protein [Hafnia alvei]